jgi:hypothetical protein
MPSKEYRELRAIQGNPIVEKPRSGDRHKDPKRKHGNKGKKINKWQRRLIVAWDGEGANEADGTHIYNLLANSDGTRIVNPNGISTKAALDFFIDYGNPNAINVIFGGSYDVNMILRDVPVEQLRQLWADGECMWGVYKIYYAPRKKLTIQKYYMEGKKLKYHTFTLWDVLGFFQSSFVIACRKWLGDLKVLDEIESMKVQRNVFTKDRLDDIIHYNKMECLLLVQLMEALFAALDEADIQLVRYDGAGSIASALLRKNKVPEHKGKPDDEVLKYAQYAYSGGRIEAPKVGNAEVPIYRYDINSAYPSGCLTLPSYKDATWTFDKEWDGQDCSLVHVTWSWDTYYRTPSGKPKVSKGQPLRVPFHPLWYREDDGTILYPPNGEGIYWGVEFRNVVDFMPPGSYEVKGACNVHLANDTKPFAYLQHVYDERLRLKQAGNLAHEAFKLGMNSTYGKLAQQAGYRNGRIPTYHQLLWAGQVTAHTRAQLYRAAMQKPRSVIAFATDAILSTDPLDLTCGSGLGEWTDDYFHGITIVQPGVYWLKENKDAEWGSKYRGFDKGSLSREGIIECWRAGEDYVAKLTRFVGLGSALMSTDFYSHWRTWETTPRVLSLRPSGKRMEIDYDKDTTRYAEGLCDTMPTVNFGMVAEVMSKPYPLLWIDNDGALKPLRDYKQMMILEDELLDSYT